MKIDKKILVISNYPIKKPLHGGQKRTAAIVAEYRKVFKDVRFLAVFVREHYPIYDKSDFFLTGEWAEKVKEDHLTSDIQIGHAMYEDPKLKRKIINLLKSFKPDVIEIEQVYPYIGLKPILEELNMKPLLVHSSHNVEAPLKEEVMRISSAAKSDIKKAVEEVERFESDLAKHANAVIAVSDEDGQHFLGQGAKSYTLAPNGISLSVPEKSYVKKWTSYFRKGGVLHIASFIGSSHLPNISAVKKIIGFRLGYVPPDSRIILAGRVGEYIEENFNYDDVLDTPFWCRALNIGLLDEKDLAAIITLSDVILLPVVEGGGSNLKTAEAILSGKKIVATSFAFRGYEEYRDLPNITIADTPDKFHKAVSAALTAPFERRTKEQESLSKKVQWKYALKKMVDKVGEL